MCHNQFKKLFMDIITLESEAFQQIKSTLESINNRLSAKEKLPTEKFYDNQEVMQMLHISKRTLQAWRDDGKINFSQVGAKIYYYESDIKELLKKNYNKKFKK